MVANARGRAPDATGSGTAPKPTTDAAESSAIGKVFIAVYNQYIETLRDIHTRVQRRYFDVQADYARAVHELQCKGHAARADAFRAYVNRMNDARGEDAHRVACDAEAQYMKDIEATQGAEQKAFADANEVAAQAVHSANAQALSDRDAARLVYSTGVRDGFAKSDPQALEPDVLAMIGQSLVAASSVSTQAVAH